MCCLLIENIQGFHSCIDFYRSRCISPKPCELRRCCQGMKKNSVNIVWLKQIIKKACEKPEAKKLMPKKILPEKICPVCKRPFTWRKKWERDWENVKYCSERCRRNKNKIGG